MQNTTLGNIDFRSYARAETRMALEGPISTCTAPPVGPRARLEQLRADHRPSPGDRALSSSRSDTSVNPSRLWRFVFLFLLLSRPASALIFTVNSESDEPDAVVGDALCQSTGGACTLRSALEEASVSAVDEVAFAVDSVTVTSNLPAISAPLTIGSCAHSVRLQGDATLDWGLRVNGTGGANIRGLIVSGFTKQGDHASPATNGAGVRLDADGNTLDCSQLTDNTYGVLIFGADQVLTGVRASGNTEDGLLIAGEAARNNRILGGVFGLTADGMEAQPNGGDGINIVDGASDNLIKEVVASGNLSAGIEVRAGAHNNTITRSTVGLDASLTGAVGNHKLGIKLLGPGNVISWSVISGQRIGADDVSTRAAGIEVEFPRNRVQHCLVGTSPDGSSAVPNAVGIVVLAGHNLVTGNTVSGNLYDGIIVAQDDDGDCAGDPDCPTSALLIARNLIGVGVDEITPLGNGRSGIGLSGVPGSPGATINNRIVRNVIANNGASGISTYDYSGLDFGAAGTGNALYGNILYNNAGNNGALGIDLTVAAAPAPSDGITPNHVGTLSGPNNFQNHPDITSIVRRDDRLMAELMLRSEPLQTFLVEVCGNVVGDPECHWPLSRKTVQTDQAGIVNFAVKLPANVRGSAVAATASRRIAAGVYETSEFSAEFPLP